MNTQGSDTDIPDGEDQMIGFRWRKKGNYLWNYVFSREPDSFFYSRLSAL